ncbi:Subtilisin-like protease SBT5.4 [Bienertia sinuspersici]
MKGASSTHKGLKKFYPLLNASNAGLHNADAADAVYCLGGSLNPRKAKGKILVCLRGLGMHQEKGYEAARVGAAGLILTNTEDYGIQIDADDCPVPYSHLTFSDTKLLFEYLNSSNSPVATITAGRTEFGVKPAPYMADFSARGPNTITPGILKPDIIAPGVRIIAAFSEAEELYQQKAPYNILDGTSMSCPHVAGIVGLLKSIYPHWSPSAIKSALMTTATPFDYGAGHVRPNRAMDPGLVYDMNDHDYLNFLCAIDYDRNMIKRFSQHSYDCPDSVSVADLNYPTISIPSFSGNATIVRRVTNVGQPGRYVVRVREPVGISIAVEPKTLVFAEKGQELEYKLMFGAKMSSLPKDQYSFGWIMWSEGKHHVRSTIVVEMNHKAFNFT